MSVKWTEADVIKAIDEAMNPPRDRTGQTNLLQQLRAQAEKQLPVRRPLPVQLPRR